MIWCLNIEHNLDRWQSVHVSSCLDKNIFLLLPPSLNFNKITGRAFWVNLRECLSEIEDKSICEKVRSWALLSKHKIQDPRYPPNDSNKVTKSQRNVNKDSRDGFLISFSSHKTTECLWQIRAMSVEIWNVATLGKVLFTHDMWIKILLSSANQFNGNCCSC